MLITTAHAFLFVLTVASTAQSSSMKGLGANEEIMRMYRSFLEEEGISDAPLEECGVKYEKVGCFSDDPKNRALPELVLNDRGKIQWGAGKWEKFLKRFACRCAEKSSDRGYGFFGLQFFSECWSGPNRPSLRSHSHRLSKNCVGFGYKKCQDKDPNECVGRGLTNYVYRIVEGGSGSGSGSFEG